MATIHVQAWPPYMCRHGSHTCAGMAPIHVQAWPPYMCRHGPHTCAGMAPIHVQAWLPYMCRHGSHTCAGMAPIHVQAWPPYMCRHGPHTCTCAVRYLLVHVQCTICFSSKPISFILNSSEDKVQNEHAASRWALNVGHVTIPGVYVSF